MGEYKERNKHGTVNPSEENKELHVVKDRGA